MLSPAELARFVQACNAAEAAVGQCPCPEWFKAWAKELALQMTARELVSGAATDFAEDVRNARKGNAT